MYVIYCTHRLSLNCYHNIVRQLWNVDHLQGHYWSRWMVPGTVDPRDD